MEPMIFCKIGWMKKYQGLDNDYIEGGGSFVAENKVGHEIYNFLNVNNKYYGYVRILNDGNLKLGRIENINNQEYIDNVTVVWVSKKPKGGVYVVGWYKNARVYKTLQFSPSNRIKKIDENLKHFKKENSEFDFSGKDFSYFFEANVSESTLLDEEDRVLKIPKKKMVQTNHWYADNADTEEDLNFKIEVNSYINQENTGGKLNNRKNRDNMFDEDIKKIEFNQYLKEEGFYFNQEIIENFLLSLKVKPFLIFTGNSGTGKTKLAQLFAKYIETKIIGFNDNSNKDKINFKKKVGKSSSSKGWTIGNMGKNIVSEKRKIKYAEIDGIKTNNIKLDPTPRIFFKDEQIQNHLKKIAEEDKDKEIDITLYLDNIYEDKKTEFNDNSIYEVIAVGSNWTDSSEIIGYYNMINEKYIQKPSLTLLLKAIENTKNPYFLILDEMNLSYVERYFNDFLSSIESGEPIFLHKKENNDIPNDLQLSNNIFVIGTVNVDETTYMFSPKVLDRSNVIEFGTISPKNLVDDENLKENSFKVNEYLANPLSDIDLKNYSIPNLINELSDVKTSYNEKVVDLIIESLDEIYHILKKVGFDFGFRVINEVLKFMYVAWKYEGNPETWDNWNRYFDAQIKQKILPKLHGSKRLLEDILHELFNFTLGESIENYPRDVNLSEKSPKFITSTIKIKNMDQILSEQHYVSFIT
jgi:energy-coupling factor transporter ATP-binding protein EcfA2